VNRLPALLSGAVDAAIVSPEERYAALDQGMKDIMFFGKEVKNSWGTFATSDRFLKEQPKQLAGFVRAVIKASKSLVKIAKAPSPLSPNSANWTKLFRRACTTTWSELSQKQVMSTSKAKRTTSRLLPRLQRSPRSYRRDVHTISASPGRPSNTH
jgi:hypothetical protein